MVQALAELRCDMRFDGNPLEYPLLGLYYLGPAALREYLKNPKSVITSGDQEISMDNLKISRLLGEGGFGSVYKALWTRKNSSGEAEDLIVAVKFLRVKNEDINPKFLDKFRREVGMMRKTQLAFAFPGSTTNFIRLRGACTQPPFLCIVTDFAEHGSLYDVIRKYPDMHFSYLLNVCRQIAEGMKSLHSFLPDAILHHDLKTKNILVMADWSIRISDFGLSRMVAAIDHKEEEFKSTAYIPATAPEVLQGARYTTAADVFSFGCILYELYTRKDLYSGLTTAEVKARVLSGERPSIPVGCPPFYSELISRCWDHGSFV
eukprot:TRINITY_DN5684_c0_g1_i2.p1 TRINITY_DN5684_c0_g1~~TRINITY_DN5684_c0_g1_i2.p1  ORF type:complete len:319 (-),score=55.72 TRINITY_DN5684_c0_g1_i2:953-1909(-)